LRTLKSDMHTSRASAHELTWRPKAKILQDMVTFGQNKTPGEHGKGKPTGKKTKEGEMVLEILAYSPKYRNRSED